MDDSEYYRITNRTSLPVDIAKIVQKKKAQKASQTKSEEKRTSLTPRNWAVTQGREDAEMLYEKNAAPDSPGVEQERQD